MSCLAYGCEGGIRRDEIDRLFATMFFSGSFLVLYPFRYVCLHFGLAV